MSLFLGPIHFWLYNKINNQEALTSSISKAFGNFDELTMERPPLEDVIDESNIHSWLQEQINDAESRYAKLVVSLINQDESNFEKIKKIAFDFGKNNALNVNIGAEEAYHKFEDFFVNGMPCDHVNMIVRSDINSLTWSQNVDIHAKYWEAFGKNSSIYYDIRKSVMDGMLSSTKLKLIQNENSYTITK